MDICSLTFDELQRKIVQARKKHFSNDLTHPTFINTEKVNVVETRKNPESIATTNLAFARDSKANTKYLMAEKTNGKESGSCETTYKTTLGRYLEDGSHTCVLERALDNYIW